MKKFVKSRSFKKTWFVRNLVNKSLKSKVTPASYLLEGEWVHYNCNTTNTEIFYYMYLITAMTTVSGVPINFGWGLTATHLREKKLQFTETHIFYISETRKQIGLGCVCCLTFVIYICEWFRTIAFLGFESPKATDKKCKMIPRSFQVIYWHYEHLPFICK